MPTSLWIILILLLFGALPIYPYSTTWGYYPSEGRTFLTLLLVLVALSVESPEFNPLLEPSSDY